MFRMRIMVPVLIALLALTGTLALPAAVGAQVSPENWTWRAGDNGYGCIDRYRHGTYTGHTMCAGNIGGTWYEWYAMIDSPDPAAATELFGDWFLLMAWDGAQWKMFASFSNKGEVATMTFYDANEEPYREIRLVYYFEPTFIGWVVRYDNNGDFLSDPITRGISDAGALGVWYANYGYQLSLCAGGMHQYCP